MINRDVFSFRRILSIIIKEIIQVRRDELSLRMAIFMPIALMLLFGYAVNTQVDKIPTAILDQSRTAESQAYIKSFEASNYYSAKLYASSMEELGSLLDAGRVKAGLVIPVDYADKLRQHQIPKTQLIIDGTEPTTARTALGSGRLINEIYSRTLRQELPGVELTPQVWYNPDLKSIRFTIPGLIGLILQNVTIGLTSFSIVRERERGTIEQLIVTPLTSLELIIAKLAPYVIIGYVIFLSNLAFCVFWFKVDIAGSLALLLFMGFIFVLCSLSTGILISTFVENQMQAQMLTTVYLLPTMLLSGFIFPREAMPAIISILGYAVPLTYFLEIIRGIMLKGVGLHMLWQSAFVLTAITLSLFTLATLNFKKRLD